MIKLGVREYIKNFWLNFISVIMICIMIISTLILTTTILRQTRIYRLISPSLGKEGVVTTIIDKDSIDKLKDVDNIIMASDTYFSSLDGNKGYKVTIYNNRMCKYIAPRLSSGKWIDDVSGKNNMIKVVISENNYGIKAGDKLEITANSENGEQNSIEIYVCGVLEEGQRVFNTFSEIDSDCTYKDFFHIYSFEQDQVPLMITTERETKKLDFKLDVQYGNAFIKYSDKISDENKENNLEILNSKFEEMTGISNYEDSFIQLKDLTKRSDKKIKNLCITYIPLIFGDFILIIVCLIGIVAVKTSKNTGYYDKGVADKCKRIIEVSDGKIV